MFSEFVAEKFLRTTSLEEAREAVEGSFKYNPPHETTLDRIKVGFDGLVEIEGIGFYPMTRQAFEMLNHIASIPPAYARSIPGELWLTNFNARALCNKRSVWITTSLNGDGGAYITAFSKDQKVQARDKDLLGLFEDSEKYEPKMIRLWDSGMQAAFAAKSFGKVEPKVGDISEIGFKVINSKIGLLSAKLEAMTFRLICSNGAIFGENFGRGYWPSDKRLSYQASFAAFTKQFSQLEIEVEQLHDLYRYSVERHLSVREIVALWRRIARATESREVTDNILRLGAEERKEYFRTERDRQEFADKSGNETPSPQTSLVLYDVFNNITEFARDASFSASHKLEEVAGSALNIAKAA